MRANATVGAVERDAAVDELIALVGGVDEILQVQAEADAAVFMAVMGDTWQPQRATQIEATVLKANRRTCIVCGVLEPRFGKLPGEMTDAKPMGRIELAMAG